MLRIRTLGASEITIGGERIGPEQRSAFVVIFLLATRGPTRISRRELARLLWPDARASIQNHRLRSLLHRLRRFGVPLACSDATVALSEVMLDFAAYARPPRSVLEIRERIAAIGPVLPNLDITTPPALADRLDDERDVIIATLMRWLRAALHVATSGGEWPVVEKLARLTLEFDERLDDAWLSLSESQLITSGNAAALRTLDEYTARSAGCEPSLPMKLLRQRIETSPVAHDQSVDDLPLIGRNDIMRRIWSVIARAREGYGGSMVLWGPAAIGKTRVLREVERVRIIESVRVVRIAGRPLHALRPFDLVVELIGRLLDEPGAAGCEPGAFTTLRRIVGAHNDARTGGDPDDYFECFTELLAALAEEATTIILMDDMHVVDTLIWRFLRAVFRWSIDHRVLWLLGYRALHERELDSLPERSLVHRLPLVCLDRTQAARLVDAARCDYCPLEFEQIFGHAGGHPALLAALARSECALPRSTEPIVDDWIARLSRDQFQVLHTLATLGGSATTRSLLDLEVGRQAELSVALGQLARHGIVEETSGTVCAHRIWADAALAIHNDSPPISAAMMAF